MSSKIKVYIIPQKMSGTGSIHDIASDQYDREIRFASGCKYAVVLAAYYGGKGYTTHHTDKAAISASLRAGSHSHRIIDVYGNEYSYDSPNGPLIMTKETLSK